jgi:hypothetical protein
MKASSSPAYRLSSWIRASKAATSSALRQFLPAT